MTEYFQAAAAAIQSGVERDFRVVMVEPRIKVVNFKNVRKSAQPVSALHLYD